MGLPSLIVVRPYVFFFLLEFIYFFCSKIFVGHAAEEKKPKTL